MSLSCVVSVKVCISLYTVVRQQSEGSYQKTDVEKTERAQEIIDSTHRLTDTKMGGFTIEQPLSFCSSSFSWGDGGRGVDSAATHRGRRKPSN